MTFNFQLPPITASYLKTNDEIGSLLILEYYVIRMLVV